MSANEQASFRITASPGECVSDVVRRLAELAARGKWAVCEFNGRDIVANPGESRQTIGARWRTEIQAAEVERDAREASEAARLRHRDKTWPDLLAARYHLTTVNAAALDSPTAQAFRDVDAAVILVAEEIDRARTAYLAYGITAGLVEDAGRVWP